MSILNYWKKGKKLFKKPRKRVTITKGSRWFSYSSKPLNWGQRKNGEIMWLENPSFTIELFKIAFICDYTYDDFLMRNSSFNQQVWEAILDYYFNDTDMKTLYEEHRIGDTTIIKALTYEGAKAGDIPVFE